MSFIGTAVIGAITAANAAYTLSQQLISKSVDIYIREKSGSREIRVPWLPESIEYKSGGVEVASYDIMNNGPVEVPTGCGLREVTWSSTFPGAKRTDDSMLRGDYKTPETYHNILEDWKAKGTPLTLLVTGYPINFDVYLKNYTATPNGGFGDMDYTVEFVENRDLTIATVTDQQSSTTSSSATTTRPTTKTTSYTIKSGDNLWSIAQKLLGSGAKWQTIYDANKEIIESTAKKYGKSSSNNGWWIYPGVTIQIPQ